MVPILLALSIAIPLVFFPEAVLLHYADSSVPHLVGLLMSSIPFVLPVLAIAVYVVTSKATCCRYNMCNMQ